MNSAADILAYVKSVGLDAIDAKHINHPWQLANDSRTGLLLPVYPMSMHESVSEFYRRHHELKDSPFLSVSVTEPMLMSMVPGGVKNQTQNCFTIPGVMDVVLQTIQTSSHAITLVFDLHSLLIQQTLLDWHGAKGIPCCFRTAEGFHRFVCIQPNSAIPRLIKEAKANPVPPFFGRTRLISEVLAGETCRKWIPAHSIPVVVTGIFEFDEVVDALSDSAAEPTPAGVSHH